MIEITATGDTTLHTAGKYCPEDILVKVPAGGGSGGGVETCTVEIIDDGGYIYECLATVFHDNEYGCCHYHDMHNFISSPCSIPNVVCGTSVYYRSPISIAGFTTTNCEFSRILSNTGLFKITANQGDVATIHCYDND